MAGIEVRTATPDPPSPVPAPGPARPRRRVRIVVALLVIGGALAWVAIGALRSNLEYYKTPTEVLHQGGAAFGQRIRLGGVVELGSVCARGATVRFVLTDLTTSVTVVTSSGVPQLFGGGRGVVAEGAYARDRLFHADDILVKHDDSYAPPKNGPVPRAATPACA